MVLFLPDEEDAVFAGAKIYWGGADKVMCVDTAMIEELVDLYLNESRPAV